MVGSVSMNNPQVYFRAKDVDINAPSKFSSAPAAGEGDKLELSEAAQTDKPKKGGILKTIGKIAGGAVALAGAAFGMFKWKGEKWLVPEAKGFMATMKKWAVKPGEFIDNNVINPIITKLSKKTDDIVLDDIAIDELVEKLSRIN